MKDNEKKVNAKEKVKEEVKTEKEFGRKLTDEEMAQVTGGMPGVIQVGVLLAQQAVFLNTIDGTKK